MNISNAVNYLWRVNKEKIPEPAFENAHVFFAELKELLNMDAFDVCCLCCSFPALLSLNSKDTLLNIRKLGEIYNIKSADFKNLVLKYPIILSLNHELFRYKIELIKTVLGCTFSEALKAVYFYPMLLSITKSSVSNQITMLCRELNEYGLGIRKLFKIEPRMLFAQQDDIRWLKKYFMQSFGLSELDVAAVIKAAPAFMFESKEELQKKFSIYYPNLFIKRDIREILDTCPEFINLSSEYVLEQIKEISEYFGIETKKACEFIRRYPNILFFDTPQQKLDLILLTGISKEYILSYPKIFDTHQQVIPVKFVLARVLGNEECFNEMMTIPLKTLLARFVFMQKYNLYEHEDLILPEHKFAEKYETYNLEELSQPIDEQTLLNVIDYYISLKDQLAGWKDIPFPPVYTTNKLINDQVDVYDSLNDESDDYFIQREKTNICKKSYVLKKQLEAFTLTDVDISQIMSRNKALKYSNDLPKIVTQIIEYGFNYEDVINLLIKKPSIFTYSYFDFLMLIDEICEDQKGCNAVTAVEKVLS